MAPRRRPARRPRRMQRRRGPRRGLKAPRAQLKTYNYKFRLAPQLIQSSLSTIDVVALNINSPVTPIDPTSSGFVSLAGTVGFPGVCDWAAAATHKLTDIANVAQWTALYDAYKINSVTVTLEYLSNASAVNGAGIMPTFYMYWDQDDAIPPSSVNTLLGRPGVRKFQPTASRLTKSFTYVPVTGNVVAQGAIAVGAVVANKSQWIDCIEDDIPHYALKLYGQDFIAAGNTQSLNMLRVHYTYNVSFRSPLRCT